MKLTNLLDAASNLIKNLAAPVDDNDAARKVDVDSKVTGPASATDNAIDRFDTTTGKLL